MRAWRCYITTAVVATAGCNPGLTSSDVDNTQNVTTTRRSLSEVCDPPCEDDTACLGGECVADCPSGMTNCAGTCVITRYDPENCGGCGTTCGAGEVCAKGACALDCPAGMTACSGVCVDAGHDPENCGACGTICDAGEVCATGECALDCPSGMTSCQDACVMTRYDSENCGGCGIVCGVDQECKAGKCISTVPTGCVADLYLPIVDPWGETWDSMERGLSTFDQAVTACQALGGRLPTATELYRVAATRVGGVGETYDTNYLWALNPYSPTSQFVVRLSDASITTSAIDASTRRPYRCLCPDTTPNVFDENACYGPAASPCSTLTTAGGRYQMDSFDRAPLSKGAAIWECAFFHGHLADTSAFLGAIPGGLPNGSGTWLHTGDDVRYDSDAVLRWTGTNTAWAINGNVGSGLMTDLRPFRCIGLNYAPGVNPVIVANEFVGPSSLYKSESVDSAVADWATAQDSCWSRGGHLPRANELGELIQQGLPNGTNAWLWTSDQEGWNETQFLAAVVRWSGIAPRFSYAYSTNNGWAYKTNAGYGYRCIYYPIDTDYSGPAADSCKGGCTQLTVGNGPATIWIDNFNRTPTTLSTAAETCTNAGGHIASQRDYTEAIRHGLANGMGSSMYVFAWDLSIGSGSAMYVGIVRWTDSERGFTDQYSTYSTWASLTSQHSYRCVWTNELR